MAFFSKKDEQEEPLVTENKGKKKSAVTADVRDGSFAHVLLRPVVTEKAHAASEKGQYAFYTPIDMTKTQVKQAVESVYKVHATDVQTSRMKPKKRVRGREVGYTKRMKKVFIRLRKGESITLFEG